MGNQDFMEFENALKGGVYPIKKLTISPANCAIIEIIRRCKMSKELIHAIDSVKQIKQTANELTPDIIKVLKRAKKRA